MLMARNVKITGATAQPAATKTEKPTSKLALFLLMTYEIGLGMQCSIWIARPDVHLAKRVSPWVHEPTKNDTARYADF